MQQGNLCTFMQIADDRKLGGVVDQPDACVTIQRDADKLEKCTDKNLLKNAKSCTWGGINPHIRAS